MSTDMKTMDDLLVHELRDLHDAEQRLAKAMPGLAKAATAEELQGLFEGHLSETKIQVDRIRKALELMKEDVDSVTCRSMKGLVEESEEIAKLDAAPPVRDAALLAMARRIEHHEMASYGSAYGFATQAGRHDVAKLLKESLDEATNADRELTAMASRSINAKVED